MVMSRISQVFANLNPQKALIPYITAGDPDLNTTLQLMHTLVDSGADLIELGVPFSDPMADGAVIQRAANRAVAQGVSLRDVLGVVAQFRQTNQSTPVMLMGYLNPIHRMGYETFAKAAAAAGVDGVLTVDCPIEEIEQLNQYLKPCGVDCIFLISPMTPVERIQAIARQASGFVYYVSLNGVTGSANLDVAAVAKQVALIKQHVPLPVGVGFGIRDAESAKAIAQVADAAIVGSRLVQTIEDNAGNEAAAVAALVQELNQAVKTA